MAMILPCMPTAYATDAADTYVKVTYLSTNSTAYEAANNDPSVVFSDNKSYYSGLQKSGGVIITGQMDDSYVISKVIVRTPSANSCSGW